MPLLSLQRTQGLARIVLPRFLQTPDLARGLLGDSEPAEQLLAVWIRSARRAGELKIADHLLVARQFRELIDAFAFWPQIFGREPPLTKKQQAEVIRSTIRLFLDH